MCKSVSFSDDAQHKYFGTKYAISSCSKDTPTPYTRNADRQSANLAACLYFSLNFKACDIDRSHG